jgi:glycosyltransferase involved in cell wall biosynthesis
MVKESDLVSIVMATYNRAHTVKRAINSILIQTYKNIELIVVDDGSTDDTLNILNSFNDPRIRIFKLDHNRGASAAKNIGLNQIKGDWFTTYDSDDEMTPDAIETMINIPLNFDSAVTLVVCNGWEPISKTFIGQGLDKDGYIIPNEVMPCCKGDFWGLTKTSLLQDDRFNEKLIGFESTLWYKINERGYGYYIHKALSIVHIEGNDRITKSKPSFEKELAHYESIIKEELYLKITKRYNPEEYARICKKGLIMMLASNNEFLATQYYNLIKTSKNSTIINLLYSLKLPASILKSCLKVKSIEHQIRKFIKH